MKTISRPSSVILPPSFFRPAFTLVELMVVIVIIALLAALILPALGKARTTAHEAKVLTDIKGLETAIKTFKSKYGVEPPSKISIFLTQTGWNTNAASMAIIRSIWPQFDFTMTMPDPANPGNTRAAYPVYWATSPPAQTDANGNL